MRTFVHAAFLTGLFSAGLCLSGAAYAADLDYPYEPPAPPPVAVVPPPVVVAPPVVAVLPPRCGFYRPCLRGWRFGWRRPWGYGYAGPTFPVAPPPEGYGDHYGDDRDRYDRERFDRYGYASPRPGYGGPRGDGPNGPRGYGSREFGPREGYRDGRPYADPLGHDRARRDERFDRYGDQHRGGEGFDRERGRPDFRDEPG